MEGAMQERIEITNEAAARVFANERSRLILLALTDRARSPAELSVLTDTPLNLISYHLRRLIEFGLARIEHETPRAGRAIRHYRATAKSFFVPARLTGPLPRQDRTAHLQAALERSFAGSYSGVLYDHDRGPRMRIISDGNGPRNATDLWHRCMLAPDDVRALSRELFELFDRYARLDRPNGRRHILHAALAPE
jgi:hypothetical protein